MGKTYSITEYGSFISGRTAEGYMTLPAHTFSALEEFILSNRDSGNGAAELMGISARRGVGKVITAVNYVGIINMKDGTTIEILPKISQTEDGQDGAGARKLLIDMLRTLHDFPHKSFQTAHVDTGRLGIFEIFIRMFVDEVFFIAKAGLKRDYDTIRQNGNVFKGKLVASGQIKYNYAHAERFYVQHDEFNVNCAENRLIKAALLFLYGRTSSNRNKTDIRILLNAFADVSESTDYSADFGKITYNRNNTDYFNALCWAGLFLEGRSFTPLTGSEVAFALLFPMETLFESYIAALVRRSLDKDKYNISVQDAGFYLFNHPDNRFLLRPDIVITGRLDKTVFLFDTKWKLLSAHKHNYGISQSDMYQMYVYQKKYEADSVTLLYPLVNDMPRDGKTFKSDDGADVKVRFIDMSDAERDVKSLMAQM